MLVLTNLDLGGNQLLNVRLQMLGSDPSPLTALIYYNTTANIVKYYNGTSWQSLVQGGDAGTLDGQDGVWYLDRANHTGTQAAATISDLATVVKAYRLDEFASPTAAVAMNSQRITGLADPTSAQDAATKAYVDAARSGLDTKQSVRAATTAALPANTRSGNVLTASANGALPAIDGVTLVVGDRLLVKDESTGANNGIYTITTVGDASNPFVLTRASDADSSAEVTSALFMFVEEGTTNADSGWTLTTNDAITLNSTALTFVQFSGAGQIIASTGLAKSGNTLALDTANGYGVRRTGVDVGDGSATSYLITHNFGTRDVAVQLRLSSGTYAQVLCDVEYTTINAITLRFASAPTTNQYHVIITG